MFARSLSKASICSYQEARGAGIACSHDRSYRRDGRVGEKENDVIGSSRVPIIQTESGAECAQGKVEQHQSGYILRKRGDLP